MTSIKNVLLNIILLILNIILLIINITLLIEIILKVYYKLRARVFRSLQGYGI